MAVPEQHDEPPRRQPGPPAARSRCPRLTILGHNQSVNFWGDPKLGPKATTYQAQSAGKTDPTIVRRRCIVLRRSALDAAEQLADDCRASQQQAPAKIPDACSSGAVSLSRWLLVLAWPAHDVAALLDTSVAQSQPKRPPARPGDTHRSRPRRSVPAAPRQRTAGPQRFRPRLAGMRHSRPPALLRDDAMLTMPPQAI